jgi:UrcA family protein
MTRKTVVAMAAAMTLALPGLAMAGTSNFDVVVDGRTGMQTRSIAVTLDDLDLLSARGYNMADNRIDRAAKKVCGYANGSILPETRDYRSCYGDALSGGRSDLDGMVAAQRAG